MPDATYVCQKCGTDARPDEQMTMMDDRYAVGYCNVCTDSKPRKTARPKSAFIRADLFDRAAWLERTERETLKKHVQSYGMGGLRLMSDKAIYEMVTFFDKYGAPGMSIVPEMRDFAKSYGDSLKERTAKAKPKRGRGA